MGNKSKAPEKLCNQEGTQLLPENPTLFHEGSFKATGDSMCFLVGFHLNQLLMEHCQTLIVRLWFLRLWQLMKPREMGWSGWCGCYMSEYQRCKLEKGPCTHPLMSLAQLLWGAHRDFIAGGNKETTDTCTDELLWDLIPYLKLSDAKGT